MHLSEKCILSFVRFSITLFDGADVPVLRCSCSSREFSRMFIRLDLT